MQVNVEYVIAEKCFDTSSEANICGPKVDSNIEPDIDHLKLARNWQISPEKALKMVRKTTHNCIRTVLHLSLYCQFITDYRNLRLCWFPHSLFGDTMFYGKIPSMEIIVLRYLVNHSDGNGILR